MSRSRSFRMDGTRVISKRRQSRDNRNAHRGVLSCDCDIDSVYDAFAANGPSLHPAIWRLERFFAGCVSVRLADRDAFELSASDRRSTAGLSSEFALEIPDRFRGNAVAALEHTRDTLRLVDRTRPEHAHAGSLEQSSAWYNCVRPKVPARAERESPVQSRCGPATVNEDESPNIHSAFKPGKGEARHRKEGATSKPGDLPGVHCNFCGDQKPCA